MEAAYAVLGRLSGTTIYRKVQQYPVAYPYHGVVLVRVDAPIYFANTSYIKGRLREYESNPDQSIRRGPEVEQIYIGKFILSFHVSNCNFLFSLFSPFLL
ncbi:probable sulfate transporter 4.2 isoform X1 [Beta vulgaris subsp. vulgaris]|uniref:probable sulfate transporter 4.2 isoform X1 n=1 Tax=Beta vulgaris subsp. vulgaris TaxID=3555 RepID=UPI00254876C7|nr:probable sulfate transporter 4.2 isoform X1 [Beta vulgaris subsp. vulgaris]